MLAGNYRADIWRLGLMKVLNIFVLKMFEMVSAGYGGYQELSRQ